MTNSNFDEEFVTDTELNEESDWTAKILETHARKRKKLNSKYVDLSNINPTSNRCERLFSQVRHIFTSVRNRLSPIMLENAVFLKYNTSYWDVSIVQAVERNELASEVDKDCDIISESLI
eukprot:NODE_822_length_3684_cov_0.348117.p4 type:complete len:120 gc:universal NODE_822_length_3684_cov_0.348117:2116-2475(+)